MSKKLIYLIFFMLALGLAQGQARGAYRAAYWDSNFALGWSDGSITIEMRDYFAAAGYEILDADQLKVWMDARIADGRISVVVFCPDIAPDTVCETNTADCTLRKYLDAGGKIVFHGDIPFWNQGIRGGGTTLWKANGATGILGFEAAGPGGIRNSYNTVQITEAGFEWGLTETWQSRRPAAADVAASENLTVLATDDAGHAAAWVKHYVPGDTSRGFVRLFDHDESSTNKPNFDDMKRVAEYGIADARLAYDPTPADKATDVPRDVVFSWAPGKYAGTHDVYFGTNFDDVNNATNLDPMGPDNIYRARQAVNSYDVGKALDFGQTYYWRIDEVNAPPTSHVVFKGDVWQFTSEPFAYPIENISATASSSQPGREPENAINGSGLDDSGLLHGIEGDNNMWLSNAAGPQPSWIEFEFDKVYKLHELWVWNSNEFLEPMVGLGVKDVSIEYSVDGNDYTTLGTTHEFARAPGTPEYAHNTTVDFGGVTAKYVRLTANSNWGGLLPQYGLSEVRFLYIPVLAREPYPDSGAKDMDVDVVLSFRAGREAAQHNVYVSTGEQAVIDGTAGATTVTEASYGPLALDLGTTYYWRIDEVNEAESPAIWQGNVWNFTTQEYFVVDDFEGYNDLDPDDLESRRIFNVWKDGYEVPTNGSLVGYENAPFCEQTIVHGGRQSMPFFFSNTGGAAYSEAELTLSPPQDWTQAGAATLVLYFHGTEGNTGQLYAKINGSKVVYNGDAGDIAKAEWKQWNIDLASLGVNLQSIAKLAIGIDGNGASGKLYVDDIRLYPLP